MIAWPESLYNPQPLADDLILPLPCGGAMAFRPVETPARPDLASKTPGPETSAVVGPFRDPRGHRYLPMGKYEVNRLQVAAVRAYADGTDCPAPQLPDGRLAASSIAWQESMDFADDWTGWLATEAQGLPDCRPGVRPCLPHGADRPATVRLPTEPEWELAARGGLAVTPEVFAQSLYPMPGGLARHVWSKDNARGQVQPIGTRAANPLGLHDLYGNVSETMLGRSFGAAGQGQAPLFVVRGGGYYDPPESLKADLRFEAATHNRGGRVRTSDTGFRVLVSAAAVDLAPRTAIAAVPRVAEPVSSAPGTDGPGPEDLEPSPELTEAGLGLTPDDRREIDAQLRRLGFDPGPPRGFSSWVQATLDRLGVAAPAQDLGVDTRRALAAFQKAQGLEATGYVNAQTRAALAAAVARLADEEGVPAGDSAEGAQPSADEQRLAEERRLAEALRMEEAQRLAEGQRQAESQRQARLAALKDVLPIMVELPGGTFRMGSPESEKGRSRDEGPRHRVAVQSFAIGQTEVTFAQYDAFARATGRRLPRDQGARRGSRPVVDVTWLDASAYATWLSEQTGLRYRLPSEAEWEYAARAGTETPFWTGACLDPDQANYDSSGKYADCPTSARGRRPPVPAGSLPANPWGLHEVVGNVAEWVQDCWHNGYVGAPADGGPWLETGGGDCSARVIRGGGWSYVPWALRSAYRSFGHAATPVDVVGFRVARSMPQSRAGASSP